VDARSRLTPRDVDSLGYAAPLAEQAGLFRVDTQEGARLVGRNGGGDYAGVVFPYYLPGNPSPREFRLRRDKPELEQQPGGALKEKNKYMSPPGRGNLLYFAPGTPAEWLDDSSIPAALTEGEKKCLALHRLAYHGVEVGRPRFMPLAVSGVWNWRGTVGKTTDEQGRRDIKGVIPDFDRVNWQGRVVYIIFDSNVATNDSVRAARRELGKELQRRGASVRMVDLPEVEGVNGVDDLLALKGPEFVLSLMAEADSRPATADERTGRKSQATTLVELAEEAELFHTPDGKNFATVVVNGHHETLLLKGGAFRDWLSHRYYVSESTTPSSSALQDALSALSGKARFEGAEVETFSRVAGHGESIYLDLCDPDWRAVKITPEGWEVITAPPVKFRRARGMLSLPIPVPGGSADELRRFVNVSGDPDLTLLLSWLVSSFRPRGPYPALGLHGEQGSAKSTTARLLRSLIDPNAAPLRSEPREERDLMIAASNGWCVAFDNLSRMPMWLSDSLCRLATGGGFATRELYANDEETLFDAQRPVLLTGIEELATRPDLLDRAIILYLPTIPEERRRVESAFWREFEQARPRILGGLLDAVSVALRNESTVSLTRLPRMADFAVWATAAESGLGLPPGAFMAAYEGNRAAANDLALEASPVAPEVLRVMAGREAWTVTYTELLAELEKVFGDSPKRPEGWPKSPRGLAGELTRVAVNLRKAGVDVSPAGRQARNGRKRVRLTRLEQPCESSSPSSPCSPSTENREDSGKHLGEDKLPHSPHSPQCSPDNLRRDDFCEDGEDGEHHSHHFSDLPETGSDEIVEEVFA
jgi:hypothetical protein